MYENHESHVKTKRDKKLVRIHVRIYFHFTKFRKYMIKFYQSDIYVLNHFQNSKGKKVC